MLYLEPDLGYLTSKQKKEIKFKEAPELADFDDCQAARECIWIIIEIYMY